MNRKNSNYYDPSDHSSYHPNSTLSEASSSEGENMDGINDEFAEESFDKKKDKKEKKKEKKKRSFSIKSLVAVIVIVVLVSGGAGFAGGFLANNLGNKGDPSTRISGTGYDLKNATGSKLTVKEIAAKTKGSVVEIQTESVQQDSWLREYVTQGAGSGVVIKSNGYIVTNNHVIDGASKISVKVDGKTYNATLVGADSSVDIAVLKINANNLRAVTYGNSDQINVGDMAVIIGNPLGSLGDSVSAGVISAKNRKITLGETTMSLLQTDASVNPGNSGGAMFNQYGHLVGVVVAKSSGENIEGLGFAIPVNMVAKTADEIMETGKSSNSENGNTSKSAYSGMAYAEKTDGTRTSVHIQSLLESNAKEAGFAPGDIVYSINEKSISTLSELKETITSYKPGDVIKYVVERNGSKVEIPLKLMENPNS